MSLWPSELTQVVFELDERLRNAGVQRVHAPSPERVFLELRTPGRSALLCVSVQPGLGRISIAPERPASPLQASGLQQVLRKELVGARLVAMRREGDRAAALDFERQGRLRTLHAEFSAGGALALTGDEGRVLALHASPMRGLKVGAPFVAGDRGAGARLSPAPFVEASRLFPEASAAFPFAEAAERLFQGKQLARGADQARRALMAPLRSRLSRTLRTLEKVRAEASRQGEAEEHRRMGELLSSNLHLVERGAKTARLTEYTAEGPIERVVPLDPALNPKAQLERHFHRYKRLVRGCERAAERVTLLEAERARLEEEIARLEALPVEALAAPEAPEAKVGPKRAGAPAASPFREYRSAQGMRILVGKSASGNDQLTFGVAKAHDLWLHVRGRSGSHVVVPLAKNAAAPQEVLLDAAHLAIHHSDAKGEPRAEVSYTPVKFVRRQKGGSPGQVTFTRERTLLVRVESERLRRLLEGAQS